MVGGGNLNAGGSDLLTDIGTSAGTNTTALFTAGQVFTLDGKHHRFIKDEMKSPCCFFQWKDEMYIPDLLARVTIYDKNDKAVAVLGDNPEAPTTKGWPNIQDKLQKGKFNSPHACCVDSHGDVYVVEWISTGRVTKLKRV